MKTDVSEHPYEPLNLSSFAAKYKVSARTFKKWLKPIGKELSELGDNSKTYTPRQFNRIINHLGSW